jgi:uncharacterized protein
MMKGSLIPEKFNSPTFGSLSWEESLSKIVKFMGADTEGSYEVIVGTDSEAQNSKADFVSALVVHKRGSGGIYFWNRQNIENLHSLKQRIWQEALISLQVAEKLVDDFASMGLFDDSTGLIINPEHSRRVDINMEIHVDVGPNGPTREMINEVTGMIRANGFKVATKPSSWGASHVADRHV